MKRIGVLLAGIVYLSGCRIEPPGPVRHETQSIDRDDAERVRVDLEMGAGNLRIGSNTGKLLRADFTYNVPSWRPEIRYSSAAGHGNLSIRQPESSRTNLGHTEYEWDLDLNREVPLELRLHFGAGEARLNLGDLSLRDVDVEMGVGKLDLDLRGGPQKSYDVRIRGGVGEATVRLPSNVGVSADVQGGLGEIHATGFRREGNRYFNDAYSTAKTTIHLDVQGGVGEIRLILS
ncbi:MAG TPA: toast rack family protein [Bryobacteraceae bacterium]|nr:toast rack family protein [Bryobacteraceae bacterium]